MVGAIVGIGIYLMGGAETAGTAFPKLLSDLPTSAIPVVLLLLYGVGSVVQSLGDVLLAPMANRIRNVPVALTEWARRLFRGKGRSGEEEAGEGRRSGLDLGRFRLRLGLDAREALRTLPEPVQHGLERPLGRFGELGLRNALAELRDEQSRKWATRLVARAHDVGSVTTATVVLVALAFAVESTRPEGEPADFALSEAAQESLDKLRRAARDAPEAEDRESEPALQQPASWKSAGSFQTGFEISANEALRLAKLADASPAFFRRFCAINQVVKCRTPARTSRESAELLSEILVGLEELFSDASFRDVLTVDRENGRPSEWDQLARLTRAAEQHVGGGPDTNSRAGQLAVATAIAVVPLLVTYVGFFLALRYAIESTLEELAIARASASDGPGQSGVPTDASG